MKAGQALWLKINYADGGVANYKRPFLIIDINESQIKVLNTSSLKGKVHKSLFNEVIIINRYKPPFREKSFLKIDALYILPNLPDLAKCLLDNGNSIDKKELDYIIQYFYDYSKNNNILTKEISAEELAILNSSEIILEYEEEIVITDDIRIKENMRINEPVK